MLPAAIPWKNKTSSECTPHIKMGDCYPIISAPNAPGERFQTWIQDSEKGSSFPASTSWKACHHHLSRLYSERQGQKWEPAFSSSDAQKAPMEQTPQRRTEPEIGPWYIDGPLKHFTVMWANFTMNSTTWMGSLLSCQWCVERIVSLG